MLALCPFAVTTFGIFGKGWAVSKQVEEFWNRLKRQAQECARQGRRLDEGEARQLVLRTAQESRMDERIPAEAMPFFISEVQSLTSRLTTE